MYVNIRNRAYMLFSFINTSGKCFLPHIEQCSVYELKNDKHILYIDWDGFRIYCGTKGFTE